MLRDENVGIALAQGEEILQGLHVFKTRDLMVSKEGTTLRKWMMRSYIISL